MDILRVAASASREPRALRRAAVQSDPVPSQVAHAAGAGAPAQRWSVTAPDGTFVQTDVAAATGGADERAQLQHRHVFAQLGSHVVEVVLDDAAATTYQRSFACYYVRRSVRSLSDADRDVFLDAVATLGSITETEARRLYGADAHALSHFLRVHLDASAGRAANLGTRTSPRTSPGPLRAAHLVFGSTGPRAASPTSSTTAWAS